MKTIKIFIKFLFLFFLLGFSFQSFASSEVETVDIKLFSKTFSGTFTETVKKDYNIDNILYIENEEKISKNYITYEGRTPSLLYLYHRNQDSSFV